MQPAPMPSTQPPPMQPAPMQPPPYSPPPTMQQPPPSASYGATPAYWPPQENEPRKRAGVVGFQFAIGGRFMLHENFGLGLEAGPWGSFYAVDKAGDDSVSVIGMYGALVGTFLYPN